MNLPLVETKAEPEPLAQTHPASSTILLVEDFTLLRKLTREGLAADYEVLVAADGREALQTAERYAGSIHLLLTDVDLPKTSGPHWRAN